MAEPLLEIVERAYGIFSKYRLSGRLNVCFCNVCMMEEDELALRTTPLREIPAKLLGEYTNSAHGFGGDEFLYFLPRYFEVLAHGEPPYYDYEYCLRRLGEKECRDMLDAEEIEVCDAFFEAYLLEQLKTVQFNKWPVGWVPEDINDKLIMIAIGGGDMNRMLRAWDGDESIEASLQIAASLRRIGLEYLYSGEVFWPFSENNELCRHGGRIFDAWLKRQETRDRLEAAFYTASEPYYPRTLSAAVTLLDDVDIEGLRRKR